MQTHWRIVFSTFVLAMLTSIVTRGLVGYAETASLTSFQGTDQALPYKLNQLRSFEVSLWEPAFRSQSQSVLPEVTILLKKAMADQGVLPLASPAEGVIQLRCGDGFGRLDRPKAEWQGNRCRVIEVLVVYSAPEMSQAAPDSHRGQVQKKQTVLWQTQVKTYAVPGPWMISVQKDPKRVAQIILDQVTAAYQN